MDIYLARGFLELPLASGFPVRVRRIRLTARSGLGCVRAVGGIARFPDVGTRKGNRTQLSHRILSSCTPLGYGFKQVTGRRVGGLWGCVWSVAWSIGWGTMISIDAWTRRGLMASDFSPFAPRLGKWLVDAIISL